MGSMMDGSCRLLRDRKNRDDNIIGKFLFVVLDKTEKTDDFRIYDSTFNIEAKFVVDRFFTLKQNKYTL